jgi:hypothetical protein
VQYDFVAALLSCAEGPLQPSARRFLMGLSGDELEFLAAFMGAAILEAADGCPCSRHQLAERIAAMQRSRCAAARPTADEDHKMILVLEFLCRSGLQRPPVSVRARHAGAA